MIITFQVHVMAVLAFDIGDMMSQLLHLLEVCLCVWAKHARV